MHAYIYAHTKYYHITFMSLVLLFPLPSPSPARTVHLLAYSSAPWSPDWRAAGDISSTSASCARSLRSSSHCDHREICSHTYIHAHKKQQQQQQQKQKQKQERQFISAVHGRDESSLSFSLSLSVCVCVCVCVDMRVSAYTDIRVMGFA